MRMSAMIKIENVSKVYGKGKKNQVQALKSIDLELEQGHNYAIIGKSGSGKSTLMNMIGLLDLPTEGKIFFKGEWFVPVNTADVQMKQKYMDMIRHGAANSSMEQINKFGLQMFYTADMENVYYAKDMDCFIVAETEGDTLFLQSIICENQVALSDVLQRVRGEYHKRQLGFTPALKDMDICVAEQYDGADDYRLFYLGKELKSIEKEKLYFPKLSHA